jgi:curved DNA-binding protein CbpA
MGQEQSRTNTYQTYYHALQQNKEVDMNQLDPYAVLNVSKNFTWDELVASYRKLAKQVHPDKGGSEMLFNTVTNCFKTLAHEYKLKEVDKPHHVLKQNFNTFEKQNVAKPSMPAFAEAPNFQDKFNRLFEENKLEDDEADRGYGHMMEESTKEREDINIPRLMKKFNEKTFNSNFDKMVKPGKEVIIYKEPEPLLLAKKLDFTELGGKTEDFTTDPSRKTSLRYTDFMKAHTTTRLVDPRSVKDRKEYKTVKDYEIDRAAITEKQMDESEIRYQKEMELFKLKQEEIRVQRLQARDELHGKHYEKVNQLMLGLR